MICIYIYDLDTWRTTQPDTHVRGEMFPSKPLHFENLLQGQLAISTLVF